MRLLLSQLAVAAAIAVAVVAWVLVCMDPRRLRALWDFRRARAVIRQTLAELEDLEETRRCPVCTAELLDIYCYLCYWNRAPARDSPA